MAQSVVGLAAHASVAPCHQTQEREKCAHPVARIHGIATTLPGELQEGHDGVHPVSRHVQSRAVVKWRGGAENSR